MWTACGKPAWTSSSISAVGSSPQPVLSCGLPHTTGLGWGARWVPHGYSAHQHCRFCSICPTGSLNHQEKFNTYLKPLCVPTSWRVRDLGCNCSCESRSFLEGDSAEPPAAGGMSPDEDSGQCPQVNYRPQSHCLHIAPTTETPAGSHSILGGYLLQGDTTCGNVREFHDLGTLPHFLS